jgi:hypothetical protein
VRAQSWFLSSAARSPSRDSLTTRVQFVSPITNVPRPRRSGKEVRSPPPPPLRTVRAPFNAYGSSIEQRPCVARPGSAPPAHDTPYGTRSPHWPWGRPGHYYGRAGYRRSAGAAPRALPPATVLLCPLCRLAVGSCPSTPGGSQLAFARGDLATPIRPATGRRSLPPPSFTRRPIGSPCGWPTLAGGRRAYRVASQKSSWVRPRLYAGGSSSAPGELGAPGPGHVPFGPSLSAPLACPL